MTTQPTNPNFLSPVGFKVVIDRTPNIEYFTQSVTIPDVFTGASLVANPFTPFPAGGDKLTYSNLSVTFKVDEDLTNYIEVYNWLLSITFPEQFGQYQADYKIASDITVFTMNSVMRPNTKFTFKQCVPVSLSALTFDTRMNTIDYIEATATFAVRSFSIDKAT